MGYSAPRFHINFDKICSELLCRLGTDGSSAYGHRSILLCKNPLIMSMSM